MAFRIAGAPGAWGIEDPANPHNPSWSRVLDEIRDAGYKGLELGPYGYLPQDQSQLNEALESRGLEIVAGTIFDGLVAEDNFASVMAKTKKTCEILAGLPKAAEVAGQGFKPPYLVIIDEVNQVRNIHSGLSDLAKRLSGSDWKRMMTHINEIASVAAGYGIRAVLHPHAGGYIEFADEIDMAVQDMSDHISLCLDTGHLYYSGMNPSAWLEKYADILDYVHFKDVNQEVYEDVLRRQTGFFEGCAEGVMCPIGKGAVDYRSVKETLEKIGYQGWITIEQERDPRDCDGSLGDAVESLKYLSERGY